MAKTKSFEKQVSDFKKKTEELRLRGYAPAFYYDELTDKQKKAVNAQKELDTTFDKGPRIGHEVQVNRYRTPTLVPNCGTSEKGYISWGADNFLPVVISKLAKSLPYTASGLNYLISILSGNGLQMYYHYHDIVNGVPVERNIPYECAGMVLTKKIAELRDKLKEESESKETKTQTISYNDKNAEPIGEDRHITHDVCSYRRKAEPVQPKVNLYAERNYDNIGTTQAMLDEAIADMRKWEETMDWIKEFQRNTDIKTLTQQWATDDVYYNLSFMRLILEQGTTGSWGRTENLGNIKKLVERPRIIGIKYQPTQCSRFEEMDDNLHINYVYYAERWRFSGTIKDMARDIRAYDNIEPGSRFRDLENIVIRNQTTPPAKRPSVCTPIYVPSTDSPYYDTVSWWSIFSSMIYNLAANLITDSTTARKNGTMWSKIIYIDVAWFDKYATQMHADTDEERRLLREQTERDIIDSLRRRENNGSFAIGDKVTSSDEKSKIYSFEVVDVPRPSASATLEDLEKVTSCIFFAMGIHPALVGAVPGKEGKSSSGTQQRELTLLKQCQLSPRQRLFLSVFEFIRDWNDLDSHLSFGIGQYVLTTLDANKTGIEEQSLN